MKFLETYPEPIITAKPSSNKIKAFRNILPDELLAVWQEKGWGVYMNGFLRLVNPSDFSEFAADSIEIATPHIPFAVTAFGDLLLWLRDGHIELVSFRKGYREIIESGMDLFLNDTLPDYEYTLKELRSEQYLEAIHKLGIPAFDECFGYFPLLALGGDESVDKLQRVNLAVHLEIMAQVVGPL